jgi:hypothetical protein
MVCLDLGSGTCVLVRLIGIWVLFGLWIVEFGLLKQPGATYMRFLHVCVLL